MVPTLRLYALIADGERGALVGPSGEIAWMCMPAWDSEAVFSSLLGGPGRYAITPEGRFVWGGYYESGSLIWRSRWVLEGGDIVECREALAFPGHPGRAVLLRRLSGEKGSARVHVTLDLRPCFGRERLAGLKRSEDGVWTGRGGGLYVRWTGGGAALHGETGLEMDSEISEGEEVDFLLEISARNFDGPPPSPEKL